MATLAAIDYSQVAHALGLPLPRVEAVVELLDEGNTVPFITRYRKDQTGGLDEEQVRQIQGRVVKLRLLAERKQTILRSIEAQGKLTPELATAIHEADTTRRLEDLYLPYKPKKQTLATAARDRGLEPLATEILSDDPLCRDLDARARDFINPDRQIKSGADALLGAGHILAEWFSERAELRQRLRQIFQRTGKLVTTAVAPETKDGEAKAAEAKQQQAAESTDAAEGAGEPAGEQAATENGQATPAPEAAVTEAAAGAEVATNADAIAVPSEAVEPVAAEAVAVDETAELVSAEPPVESVAAETVVADAAVAETNGVEAAAAFETPAELPAAAEPVADEAPAEVAAAPVAAEGGAQPEKAAKPALSAKAAARKKKEEAKAKRLAAELRAFRDYFQYSEELSKIPPHRILAINRGEKLKAIRVRLEFDQESMLQVLDELLVPPEHSHAEFLRGCARDALHRLVLPSLEREVRRELTEQAEQHAVQVFARNLRNLLLQPPVRGRRVLALDPGFKSGCKVVALDEFGQVLEHTVVFLIGNEQRRNEATTKAVELIRKHSLSVVAIGNGTACRETERWVSQMIAEHLQDLKVEYVIVNEAGASVYSTSRVGREELPDVDATVRGTVSIGRRLLDPLSELVKIEPANIGVGMYQHDLKGKHLQESLDAVVESCVNFVGVDLNTASPALLRYVSGLNQLTAQRVFDHRSANGPFRNREQLKEVTGFGEGTFVQAAGFLKIVGGDNPLDATWIHPESYAAAEQVLRYLNCTPADLADKDKLAQLAESAKRLDVEKLAAELNIGSLTLADIISQIIRPGRDPRESLPPPVFKQHVLKLDDLVPGMELAGTVLNVVDFGAFVDIGLKDSGLVHISQLADRYVQDPHEVVSVGDNVRVWVLEVDKERRRVSLTMIDPRNRKPAPPRRGDRSQTEGGEGQRPGGRPPRPSHGRPQQQRGGQRPPYGGNQPGGGGDRPPRRQGGRKKSKFNKSAAPVQYEAKPAKEKEIKLTKAKREGRKPLQTFGELFQLMKEKDSRQGGADGGTPPADQSG